VRILVTGARGMLGRDLCEALSREHEVVGVDIEDTDITVPEEAGRLVKRVVPALVVHCAAYTEVDDSEINRETAFLVNGEATKRVALACREVGAAIVYLSTDYVFDGSADLPYVETDTPSPLGVYGASKLAGEAAVREIVPESFVIRTSWLFGLHGRNFVDTIIRLGQDRQTLEVVSDQVGSPTFTRDLSAALTRVVGSDKFGTYHVANSGNCSWFTFAQEILRVWGNADTRVVPIDSERSGRRAKRPPMSVLDTSLFRATFGVALRHWKEALAEYVELKRKSQTDKH
jgi:dTDP-4-dehydrorhamnose reductase